LSDPTLTVIALLVTGYLLLAVEAFVIPGFGVPGIAGLISLGAGCYIAYQELGAALGTLTIVAVLSSVTAFMWWLPKTRFGRDVVHSSTLATAKAAETTLESGDIGITESDLRPAGVARFGELRQSVVTEGEFVDTQTRVVVTEVRGSRVVVEAAASDNALPT
jgi:membrane-bound serine protease (ClpP class)